MIIFFVKTEGYKKFKFDFETLFDPIVALYTRAKEGRHAAPLSRSSSSSSLKLTGCLTHIIFYVFYSCCCGAIKGSPIKAFNHPCFIETFPNVSLK